jgi:hypothetical protein
LTASGEAAAEKLKKVVRFQKHNERRRIMERFLRSLKINSKAKTVCLVVIMISFFIAIPLYATEDVFQFANDSSLQTSLLQFKGKTIEIQLKSGQQLTGKVSEVGNHLILLKELRGKEYYDALIEIDDIAALIFKAR